jgi:hypothetical protein
VPLAQDGLTAYVPFVQTQRTLGDRVTALVYKLANVVAGSDAITVTGANLHVASGQGATVAGGRRNVALGWKAEVSGGYERTDTGDCSWAAGSLWEER